MESTLAFYTTYLAAVYNCGTYSGGSYNVGEECTTTTDPGTGTDPGTTNPGTNPGTTTTTTAATGSNAGSLVDTGSPVFYAFAGGILLVVVALSVIAYKVVRHKQATK